MATKPRDMTDEAWAKHQAESKAAAARRARVEVDPVAAILELQDRIVRSVAPAAQEPKKPDKEPGK